MLINLFANRAFSPTELTAVLEDTPYRPEFLGAFGDALFPTVRSRLRIVAIVKKKTGMALIPVSPIGAPPVELEGPSADVRYFGTRRLAKGSTVTAEELQGVLQLPDFTQLVAGVQAELAVRATEIRADIETTHEHMRLGAIFGKVVDADGIRVLDDWFANWGVPEPTAFNFHLDVATTNVRSVCTDVRDAVFNASPGSWVNGRTVIHGLCGGNFYKLLTSHPTIERMYLNTVNALQLGQEQADTYEFGGIVFHKYRNTPGGEFSIGDDEVRFFPLGARDAFQRVAGPGEFMPFINQPGQDVYGLTVPDRERDAWMRYEGYSYPLYICLRPEMLQKGIAK